jgi:hypothetical protein
MAAYWGVPTWRFFHTLAEQVPTELCQEVAHMIQRISQNVPCPDCQVHAKAFWTQVNISHQIRTPHDLQMLLHTFHNSVNRRTGKAYWPANMLKYYAKMDLMAVFMDFKVNYYTRGNMTLMADEMQRQRLLAQVSQWLIPRLGLFVAITDATV